MASKHGIETWDRFMDDFMRHWPTADPHTCIDFLRDGNARTGDAGELRLCERWTSGAKSVFQFDVQGQVAKSTHAGIPWLLWLREMFAREQRPHFWPFDGFDVPNGAHVIAEKFPQLYISIVANDRGGLGRLPGTASAVPDARLIVLEFGTVRMRTSVFHALICMAKSRLNRVSASSGTF